MGNAEFVRSGKKINFMSECDVYEFAEGDLLCAITSYCISNK